jgi:DNA polymerase elongation subunit (family B)
MTDFDYPAGEEDYITLDEFLSENNYNANEINLPNVGDEQGENIEWLGEHHFVHDEADGRDEDQWDSNNQSFLKRSVFRQPRKVAFWNLNQYMIQRMSYHRALTGPNSPITFILINNLSLEPELDLIPSMLDKNDVKEPHIYLYGKVMIPQKISTSSSSSTVKTDTALLTIDGIKKMVRHDQIVIIRLTTKPINWKQEDKDLHNVILSEVQEQARTMKHAEEYYKNTIVYRPFTSDNENCIPSDLLPSRDQPYTVFNSLNPYISASSRGFLSDNYLKEVFAYINENIHWRCKNDLDPRKRKLAKNPAIVGFSRIPPSYIEFPSIDGLRIRKKGMPRSMLGFMPDEDYDPNFYRIWLSSKEYTSYVLKVMASPKYLQTYEILRLYNDEEFDAQWRLTFGLNFNEIFTTTQYRLLPENIRTSFFTEVGTIPQSAFLEKNIHDGVLFLEASYDAFIPYTTPMDEKGKPTFELKPYSLDTLSFDLECANHDHSVTKERMFPVAYVTPQGLQRAIAKTYLSDAAQKRINAKVLENKCPDFCQCPPCKSLTPYEREDFKLCKMKDFIREEIQNDERLLTKYPTLNLEQWFLDPEKDVDKVLCICFVVADIESTSVSDPCQGSTYYILTLSPNGTMVDMINEKLFQASKRFNRTKVIVYKTEIDLIAGFLDMIKQICPSKITGYNIIAFDLPYLQDRFKWYTRYGTPEEKRIVQENPFSLTLINGFHREYTTKTIFRPNLGIRTVYTSYPFLLINLDVLEAVSNETFSTPTKIRSFKLNYIAAMNLFYPGTKEPMRKLMVDASRGVEMWKGSKNQCTLFLFYCLWDAVLALGLCRAYGFSKLMDTVDTTCGILPSYVYSTGVIEKILAQYRITNYQSYSRSIMPISRGGLMNLINHPNVWLFSPSRCSDEDLKAFPYAVHTVCEKTGLIIPHILEVAARRCADDILKGEEKPFLPTINYDRAFMRPSLQKHTVDTSPSNQQQPIKSNNLLKESGLYIDPVIMNNSPTLPVIPKLVLQPPASSKSTIKQQIPLHHQQSNIEFPPDPIMDEVFENLWTHFPQFDVIVGKDKQFKSYTDAMTFLNNQKKRACDSATKYLGTYFSESEEHKLIRYRYHYRLKNLLRLFHKLETSTRLKEDIFIDMNDSVPHSSIPTSSNGQGQHLTSKKFVQRDLLTGQPIIEELRHKKGGVKGKGKNSNPSPSQSKPEKPKKNKKKPFIGGYNKSMFRCFLHNFTIFNDFNSLYPSEEKAVYLCFENLFTIYMSTHVYPHIPPFKYRNVIVGPWDDTICGEFLFDQEKATTEFYTSPTLSQTGWIQDPDCLTNKIVDTLLSLRGVAKKHMENHKSLLCENQLFTLLYQFDGKPMRSLMERLLAVDEIEKDNDRFGDHKLNFLKEYGIHEIKPEMTRSDLLKVHPKISNLVNAQELCKKSSLDAEIAIIYHKNQEKNFNIQQNGFKILNNSGFGFFGSSRGLRELAASITGRGRFQIQLTATLSDNTCMLKTMVRNCNLGPYVLSLGLHPGAWYPHQYDPNFQPSTKSNNQRHYDEHYVSKDRLKWPPVTEEHRIRKASCTTYKSTVGGDTDSAFNTVMRKFMDPSNNGKEIPAATLDIIPEKEREKFKKSIQHYEIIKKAAFYEAGTIVQQFLPLEYVVSISKIPPRLDVFHGTNQEMTTFFKNNNIEPPPPTKTQPFWYQVAKIPSQKTQQFILSSQKTSDVKEEETQYNDLFQYIQFAKDSGFVRILSQKTVVEKISDYMLGFGGKKRYGYNNLEIKKLVLKGLSLVRGDALPITSKLLDSCFKKIFFYKKQTLEEKEKAMETLYSNPELKDYVWRKDLEDALVLAVVQMFEYLREQLEILSENKNLDISEFTLSQRLKKDPSMYESDLPHVGVATKLLQRGDTSISVGSTIRYVFYLDPLETSEKDLKTLIAPTKSQLKPKIILKPAKDSNHPVAIEEQASIPAGGGNLMAYFKQSNHPSDDTKSMKKTRMTGSLLHDIANKPKEIVLSHVFKRSSDSKMNADTPEYVVNKGYTLDLQYYIIEKIIPTIAIALSPIISNNESYPHIYSGMSKDEVQRIEEKQKNFIEEQKRIVSSILITDKLTSNLQNIIEHHNNLQLKNNRFNSMVVTERCIVCLSYFKRTTFKGFGVGDNNKDKKRTHLDIQFPICPTCENKKTENIGKAIHKRTEEYQELVTSYKGCVEKCEKCIIRNEVGLNPEAMNVSAEQIRDMKVDDVWTLVTTTKDNNTIEQLLDLDGSKYEDTPFVQKVYPEDLWISNYFQCKYDECSIFRTRNNLHLKVKNVKKTLNDLTTLSNSMTFEKVSQ